MSQRTRCRTDERVRVTADRYDGVRGCVVDRRVERGREVVAIDVDPGGWKLIVVAAAKVKWCGKLAAAAGLLAPGILPTLRRGATRYEAEREAAGDAEEAQPVNPPGAAPA